MNENNLLGRASSEAASLSSDATYIEELQTLLQQRKVELEGSSQLSTTTDFQILANPLPSTSIVGDTALDFRGDSAASSRAGDALTAGNALSTSSTNCFAAGPLEVQQMSNLNGGGCDQLSPVLPAVMSREASSTDMIGQSPKHLEPSQFSEPMTIPPEDFPVKGLVEILPVQQGRIHDADDNEVPPGRSLPEPESESSEVGASLSLTPGHPVRYTREQLEAVRCTLSPEWMAERWAQLVPEGGLGMQELLASQHGPEPYGQQHGRSRNRRGEHKGGHGRSAHAKDRSNQGRHSGSEPGSASGSGTGLGPGQTQGPAALSRAEPRVPAVEWRMAGQAPDSQVRDRAIWFGKTEAEEWEEVHQQLPAVNEMEPSAGPPEKVGADEDEWEWEEESDDEPVTLQAQALAVYGEPDFDSGPPSDGMEFLRRVRYERDRCPKVVVAPVASTALPQEQTKYMPSIPDVAACPPALLPSREWELAFLADFSQLRLAAAQQEVPAGASADVPLPPVRDAAAWHVLCFGTPADEALPGGTSSSGHVAGESTSAEVEATMNEDREMDEDQEKDEGREEEGGPGKVEGREEDEGRKEDEGREEDEGRKEDEGREKVESRGKVEETGRTEPLHVESVAVDPVGMTHDEKLTDDRGEVKIEGGVKIFTAGVESDSLLVDVDLIGRCSPGQVSLGEIESLSVSDGGYLDGEVSAVDLTADLEGQSECTESCRGGEERGEGVSGLEPQTDNRYEAGDASTSAPDVATTTGDVETLHGDVAATSSGNVADVETPQDEKNRETTWKHVPPLLAILLRLDEVSRALLLRHHARWLTRVRQLSLDRARWLFALAVVVDKPLDGDTSAAFRSVLRKCAELRAMKEGRDDPDLPMLNVLIAISGQYFGQAESAL